MLQKAVFRPSNGWLAGLECGYVIVVEPRVLAPDDDKLLSLCSSVRMSL